VCVFTSDIRYVARLLSSVVLHCMQANVVFSPTTKLSYKQCSFRFSRASLHMLYFSTSCPVGLLNVVSGDTVSGLEMHRPTIKIIYHMFGISPNQETWQIVTNIRKSNRNMKKLKGFLFIHKNEYVHLFIQTAFSRNPLTSKKNNKWHNFMS